MGDFKPASVYVGVMELFTVLLPGAFLAAGILFALPGAYLAQLLASLPTDAAQWVAFLFCAYALGAFVFPAAALLDETYSPYRKWQTRRRADHAYNRATALRCAFLGAPIKDAKADNPMNTFKWAKSMLMLQAPAAYADVQRHEAESKFFRSLAVALPVVGLLAASRPLDPPLGPPVLASLTLLLIGLSYWRYAEQRFKSTEAAYMHVITLQLGPKPATAPKPSGD